jgi:predicted AlkP superfamily phosphohydrolase/phosphomutase
MDLIVLGVDGVDPEFLEEALEKRDMPNWEKLKQESFYSELPSTLPSITIPAWPCMFSGYNPGRFDTYHMNTIDVEKMDYKMANSSDFSGNFVWDKIEKTSSLHFIPGTSPAYEVDGWMRSGFPSPGVSFYPESFGEQMEEKFDLEDMDYESETGLAREMMGKEADLFISVVRMTDEQSHYADRKKGVLDAYERTDEFLGNVMDKAEEEDANLLVVSDHGFMHAERKFNILHFLEKMDLLEFNEDRESSMLYKMAQPLLRTPLERPLKYVHDLYEDFTGETLNDTEDSIISTISGSSKVLPSWEPVGRDMGLKLSGKLDEEEREEVLEQLEEELVSLKENGKKVVEEVWRGKELYSDSENRPDLVFRTTEDFIPDTLTSDMMFVNTSSFTHDANGVFLARGPDVDEGAEESPEIFDVAPLMYALLGEQIPDDLDAELPEELLEDGVEVSYVSDELKGLNF